MTMDGIEDKKTLLVVDDEAAIVDMLQAYFEGEGYRVLRALDARAALDAVSASLADDAASIDVALLDVNMPGMDGFELCRRVREHLSCPIIFLTARVEDADQLDGFAAGGDDYVLKPFSLAVLASRVRAHLARDARRAAPAASVRIFSSITIDYAARTVTVVPREADPVALDLTRTEFDIVAMFSKNPGRVYDREQIYEQVWSWDAAGDPGIVREHVRRVRRKFAEAGCTTDPIGTVWGVGYRWEAR